MSVDPTIEASARGYSYKCTQCGAQMRWDAQAGQLACDSCGTRRAPEAAPPAEQGQVREIPLDQGMVAAKSQGLGVPVVSARCDECGAVVQFTGGATATRCAFCDSPKVLEQKSQQTTITPESLIPFGIDENKARESFKIWLGKLWFRPGDLKSSSKIKELRGVYVPYWTFDARAQSNWSADAGYHYYVDEPYTTTENGRTVHKTRRVQHTRWEPASGRRDDKYDDKLVCASKGLPDDLVRKVSNFQTGDLVPYNPSFLAGWSAEAYAIDLQTAWKTAQAEIVDDQRSRCSRDVPGDTQRALRVNTGLSEQTFKHVLLPVWIAAFRYQEKVYRFLVNGQTGKVTGKAPLSWFKILAFIAAIVGIIIAIIFLVRR